MDVEVNVFIPAPVDPRYDSWARAISMDGSGAGLKGTPLERGREHTLKVGTVIFIHDQYPDEWCNNLFRVSESGMLDQMGEEFRRINYGRANIEALLQADSM